MKRDNMPHSHSRRDDDSNDDGDEEQSRNLPLFEKYQFLSPGALSSPPWGLPLTSSGRPGIYIFSCYISLTRRIIFLAGIFMGLMAGLLFVMIIYLGLSALLGLKVSYAAFEKDNSPAAAKKQQ